MSNHPQLRQQSQRRKGWPTQLSRERRPGLVPEAAQPQPRRMDVSSSHAPAEAVPQPERLLALYRRWRAEQRGEESLQAEDDTSDPARQLIEMQEGQLLQQLYLWRLSQQQAQQVQPEQQLGGNQRRGSKRPPEERSMGGSRGKGKRPADVGVGGAQSIPQQTSVSATANCGGGGDDDDGGEKKTRFIWSAEVGPPPSPSLTVLHSLPHTHRSRSPDAAPALCRRACACLQFRPRPSLHDRVTCFPCRLRVPCHLAT